MLIFQSGPLVRLAIGLIMPELRFEMEESVNNEEKEEALISVILPVHNVKESFLREAVDSVLKQTYTNFELIIINDGADEETVKVLESYTDKRIKLVSNPQNYGVTKSLNIGLGMARGTFIA